ncbi:MAG: small subunit ribosomal protein S9 [Flavobacteriaceae bacterium]|jgi:small subunit ribosomal protein S9
MSDNKNKYIEAVGRRKTSTARVRITPATKEDLSVNGKKGAEYFPVEDLLRKLHDPFSKIKVEQKFNVSAKVLGGGINSQAEAVRHGISRALVKFNEELRGELKALGFLKRDPRSKERRKFGNAQSARAKKQWSKR